MARRALAPAQLAVVQAVRRLLDEAAPALPASGAGLVVGLSGGADSLCLAAAVAHLRPGSTAVVVDHALQPGSDQVARRAADQARALGLAAEVVRVDVDTRAPGGLEAAARTARLDALAARGGAVLLAHTLDDQAETVLLGLARGSGPRSLQGMAPVASWRGVPLLRPLLDLPRERVHRAGRDWGLEPWADPMNDDTRFARVRVRHQLLPALDAALGPGTTRALARTATLLRDDADLLDALAAEATARCARGDGLDARALAAEHPALRSRVVRGWLAACGVTAATHQHVEAAMALVDGWHGQAGVDLPGGVRVTRRDGRLVTHHDGRLVAHHDGRLVAAPAPVDHR